jgi:heme oxygenase
MIRFKKIVKKSELLELLTNPEYNKVEVVQSDNKGLYSDNVRVRIHIKVPINSLHQIVGDCAARAKELLALGKRGHTVDYLGAMGGRKSLNNYEISSKAFFKLLKIQEEEGLPLNVTKKLVEMVRKHTDS